MSLTRARKVLEYIVRDVYQHAYAEPAGTRPLENLLQRLGKDGRLPKRLAAYANGIHELGNVGAHGFGEGVTVQDVFHSLTQLVPIVEWYFQQRGPSPADSPPEGDAAPPVAPPARGEGLPSSRRPSRRRLMIAAVAAAVPVLLGVTVLLVFGARWAIPGTAPPRPDGAGPDPVAASNSPPGKPEPAAAPFDAEKAKQLQKAWADYLGVPVVRDVDLDGATMKLTLIPPGKFQQGSPDGEAGRYDNEGPQHPVAITRAFYLGVSPVTKGQFAVFVQAEHYATEAETNGQGGYGYNAVALRYVGPDPKYTWKNTGWDQTDEHPVVNVSWNDAQKFCAWLSRKDGKTWDLPTEAEWEYACRAGTASSFWSGDNGASLKGSANIADASLKMKLRAAALTSMFEPPVSWDDGYPFTSPVGSFAANPWELSDMHGNVWQWCADSAGKYSAGLVEDPKGGVGEARVLRGGSWYNGPRLCRSAYRNANDPGFCYGSYSFRVALRVPARNP
jgi:formylglycine-generating enzyme required for sulfatase activity